MTFKQGAEVSPAGDTALRRELSHGCLQQEHREATDKKKQDVGNQKHTWERKKTETLKY